MDAARAALKCPGVEEVRIVYRRGSAKCRPPARSTARPGKKGSGSTFLRAPESWVLRLGPGLPRHGAGSRRIRRAGRVPWRPSETETLPADTVIAALGAEVDAAALAALGLAAETAAADPVTQETGVPGVFLLGDAAEGAATIVRAIASARRAVDAIAAREGGARFRGVDAARGERRGPALRARPDAARSCAAPRDDAAVCAAESARCLGCRALCMKCVEVCPNRANTLVRVAAGFRDEFQIVHIDAFCNECGNCATFCPWEGRPYKDKLTVFATEEDFTDSTNPGFFLTEDDGNDPRWRNGRDARRGRRPGTCQRTAATRRPSPSCRRSSGTIGTSSEGHCPEAAHDPAEECHRRAPASRRGDPGCRHRHRRHRDPGRRARGRRGAEADTHHRPRRPAWSCPGWSAATITSTRVSRAGSWRAIAPCPDFVSTLQNLWWRLDRAIDADILRLSGLVCALEAVKAGCTAVIDHHASPSFIDGLAVDVEGKLREGRPSRDSLLRDDRQERAGRGAAGRGGKPPLRRAGGRGKEEPGESRGSWRR